MKLKEKNMNFNRFKWLVKERKTLKANLDYELEKYKTGKHNYLESSIDKMEEKLKLIEEELLSIATKDYGINYNNRSGIDFRLEASIKGNYDTFENEVCKFFIEKGLNAYIEYDRNPSCYYLEVANNEKVDQYEINFSYHNGVDLDVLYTNNGGEGLKKLLDEYPELEEVFWNIVEEEMKKENTEQQKTLIQRMQNRQQTIDFLSDKQKVREELNNLQQEKEEDIEKFKELMKEADEVKI